MNIANTSPDWIPTLSAFAQTAIALGAFALSIVFWRASKRQAKAEYMRSIQQAWLDFNALVLSNPDLTEYSDELFGVTAKGGESTRLRRYLAYQLLNIVESDFIGHEAGLSDEDYHLELNKSILTALMKHDDIYEFIPRAGYHPGFVDLCHTIRNALAKTDNGGQIADPSD